LPAGDLGGELAGEVRVRRSGVPAIDRVIGGLGPGLPLVLAGPTGSGRTVLALQVADAALRDNDIVVFLTAEPPRLLLQHAATLGLDLDRAVAEGQLILLELDPGAPSSLHASGARSLVGAILTEHPSTSLIVVDPFTALTAEIADEAPLRAVTRDLLAATPRATLVLTVETGTRRLESAVERVLAEVCGSFLRLARDVAGRRTATLEKTRAGAGAAETVEFRIGPGGVELVGDLLARGAPEPASARPPPSQAAAPPTPLEVAPAPEPPAPGRRKILVIDDDAALRREFAEWLGERHDVVTVADGFEAMTALLLERPHLIVLDLVLPRVSGFEVLAALHPLVETTPILALCEGTERRGDRLGPLVLGAADVLAKPVPRFELLHKVEMLLHLVGARRPVVDAAHAKALFAAAPTRVLDAPGFRERVHRARDFGSRFGLPSALVTVEAPSLEVADALASAAERSLRVEDALLLASKRRLVLLLVAAERSQADPVLERIVRLASLEREASEALRWRVFDVQDGGSDVRSLFGDRQGEPGDGS
jgi:DNA-binding response OmpR family regulator/KaiC/GvpD/RAD55 family RecA-like ATPase